MQITKTITTSTTTTTTTTTTTNTTTTTVTATTTTTTTTTTTYYCPHRGLLITSAVFRVDMQCALMLVEYADCSSFAHLPFC